jgi:hypothetical protein
MLEHALQDRHVPDIWPNQPDAPDLLSWERRRLELVDLLSQHVYGYAPDIKVDVEAKVLAEDDHAFAGKAMQKTIELAMELPAGRFSFPLQYVLPYSKRSVAPASQDRAAPGAPLFIHIAFHPDVPDKYLPAEELIDAGFALLNFCYQDVALDREDPLATGLPGFFPAWLAHPQRWGTIGMWAWAASRVMDFAEQELARGAPLDLARTAVVGHSRLGKTALWAGANDPRFKIVISNESGCAGAALERGGSGEDVAAITRRFNYWFCPAYARYAGRPDEMPFDQHFLLAANAPRAVYIASAAEDDWADPDSEFLSAYAAGKIYPLLGLPGLVTEDRWPDPDCLLTQGHVAYHRRPGSHYLSRADWQRFMAFCQRPR